MRKPYFLRACLVLACSVLPTLSHAVPTGFQNEILITGLTEPTGLTFTPDQRMLIIERAGRIWVVQAGASAVDPTPFLNITNVNILDGERGLTCIVLDPNFATNGYYYVFYTCNSPLRDRVSRFTASGNSTVVGSEFVVWQNNTTASSFHHGGALAFGPDGYLYISVGDQGVAANVQSLSTYNGKLLRVSSNGTIPATNPFYDGAGPNLDEIWAQGLRNPFRMSFDSVTGRLIIDDNGDNDPATSIEEINLGAVGANYGWPVCQGPCGTVGMTSPIYSYPHGGRDSSITGGVMYRGSQFPAQYNGTYFFGDYVQNWIRRLTFDVNGNVTGAVNFEPENGAADGPYGDIVDLKVGPDGALYYADIGLSWEGAAHAAAIRRIRYTATNQPPIAQAAANPMQGLPPLTVNFSSAGSSDPEGQTLSYTWTFGDTTTSTLANPSHQYSTKGTYIARLTVSDGSITSLSDPITITVGTPPTAVITAPLNNATFRAGDSIVFGGSATNSVGSPIPASGLSWNIQFLHDNHTHPFLGPVTNITGGNFIIPLTGHDYRGFTRYIVSLTATDSDGLKNTASVLIFPQKVNLTMQTSPDGLNLIFDGITELAPFLWDTLIGFHHTMEAPTQIAGSTQYNFGTWSDSGAQIHTITVPAQDKTFTATFQVAPHPAGLMLAYRCEEGSGGTTGDWSGNGRTGTLTGATWTASGRYGNGLVFNGTSARVASPSLTLPSTFTIMAWVNNSVNSGYETIASIGKDRDLYLQDGTLILESPVPGTVRSFGTVPAASWHHVAVTSDGTVTRAYLDGNPLGATGAAITDSFAGAFQLGAWNNGTSNVDFFSGTIDEVRVYSVALSQAQIQSDMNTPISTDADGDGVLDIYESNTGTYTSGTNTGTSANNPDSDSDGFVDGLELADGTNPNDASSNLPRANVYVQFGAPMPRAGTVSNPVATVSEALRILQTGGTIHFMTPGNTNEKPVLNKAMILRAEGGITRLGKP